MKVGSGIVFGHISWTAPGELFLLWLVLGCGIGAGMWTYKSVVILATGNQPDYWFELALAFFGVSVLLLVYALRDRLGRSSTLITTLGWVATVGGGLATVAYIAGGDDGLFGPAALVTMVSIVVALFLIGGQIRHDRLLRRYSFGPRLLGWLFVISIPLGAVISGIDERLLQVALLGTVVGLGDTRLRRSRGTFQRLDRLRVPSWACDRSIMLKNLTSQLTKVRGREPGGLLSEVTREATIGGAPK